MSDSDEDLPGYARRPERLLYAAIFIAVVGLAYAAWNWPKAELEPYASRVMYGLSAAALSVLLGAAGYVARSEHRKQKALVARAVPLESLLKVLEHPPLSFSREAKGVLVRFYGAMSLLLVTGLAISAHAVYSMLADGSPLAWQEHRAQLQFGIIWAFCASPMAWVYRREARRAKVLVAPLVGWMEVVDVDEVSSAGMLLARRFKLRDGEGRIHRVFSGDPCPAVTDASGRVLVVSVRGDPKAMGHVVLMNGFPFMMPQPGAPERSCP